MDHVISPAGFGDWRVINRHRCLILNGIISTEEVVMRLSGYARKMGVTWKTANRWFHAGQIPGAYQLPSGTIIVPDDEQDHDGETIVYARVSGASQRKTDLETQAKRLVNYSNARGWNVDRIVKEVGSGLNDRRPKLEAILTSSKPVARIVFEHKGRTHTIRVQVSRASSR
jgi:predicted site-specific integrase-resolvase